MPAIRTIRVDWDLDELLEVLGNLNQKNLQWFLEPLFPKENLTTWKEEELLELGLNAIQQWEKKCTDPGQFLVSVAESLCRSSFEAFVRMFWDEVPGSQRILWGWHMDVYCNELQTVSIPIFNYKPRPHDLICNVSPGESKSSIWSVLFPCWVWTRMPKAALITASHTDSLVTDLASKSRDVMYANRYRALFPEIQFSESLDSKGHYRNTLGGERFTCTVAGKSPIGKHSHFCLPWSTPVTTEVGELPIGLIVDKKLDIRVLGYDHIDGALVWKEIEDYGCTPGRPISRVDFSDGTFVEATANHPIYVVEKGYIPIEDLIIGDEVIYVDGEDLYSLRENISEGKERCTSYTKKEQLDILLPSMCMGSYERYKSPSCGQKSSLPGLWSLRKNDGDQRWEKKDTEVLFSKVQSNCRRNEKAERYRDFVFNLWEECCKDSLLHGKENVLLEEVCRFSTFTSDERICEPELYSWKWLRTVSGSVSRYSESDQKEGQLCVPVLRSEGRGSKEERTTCPSYRLGQEQQCNGKSDHTVSTMSCRPTGGPKEESSVRKKTVVSIVHGVWIPSKVYNLQIEGTNNYFANKTLLHNSIIDDPLDPKKVLSEAERKTAADFITKVMPSRRMRGPEGDVYVSMLVMQRLGLGDSTDVMLETAKLSGACPVRHICLPAELTDDVSPPELREHYLKFNSYANLSPEGLMDPIRLSRTALNEQRALLGEYAYAGQFLQKPRPIAGGMFKVDWFNRRCVAAPFNAKRIRYFDRASSKDTSACATAGVLMAYDGEKIYVEDVVYGRWEPDERNAVMLATAQRDRTKYGRYEPTIYVEAEGGSSGRDAWLGVVRTLIGFPVREDRVQGSKDTRAEPWACQLAAGNVWMVDNGASQGLGKCGWDIEGYVEDHLGFRPQPGSKLGRQLDRIDASSGAFNLLVGVKRAFPALRTIALRYKKGDSKYIIVCLKDELPLLEIDDKPSILLSISDPEIPLLDQAIDLKSDQQESSTSTPIIQVQEVPEVGVVEHAIRHRLSKNIAEMKVSFADLNPAECQGPDYDKPVGPWNLPVEKLQLSRELGKKIWGFLFKKYDPTWQVLILVDEDGNLERALSVAYGLVDGLHIPRSVIHIFGEDGIVCTKEDDPPNEWVYDQLRVSKCYVVEN